MALEGTDKILTGVANELIQTKIEVEVLKDLLFNVIDIDESEYAELIKQKYIKNGATILKEMLDLSEEDYEELEKESDIIDATK